MRSLPNGQSFLYEYTIQPTLMKLCKNNLSNILTRCSEFHVVIRYRAGVMGLLKLDQWFQYTSHRCTYGIYFSYDNSTIAEKLT